MEKKVKKCTRCGKEHSEFGELCHSCKVSDLMEEYPDIPACVFDIEASEEMAAIYYDQMGY